jgi:hypothetical protein
MHFVKDVKYLPEYKQLLTFEGRKLTTGGFGAAPRRRSVRAAEGPGATSKAFISTLIWIRFRTRDPGSPIISATYRQRVIADR